MSNNVVVIVLAVCAIGASACASPATAPSTPTSIDASTVDAHGRVVDRFNGGVGIPRAYVCPSNNAFPSVCVFADVDGRFILSGLGAATFDLFVTADGFTSTYQTVRGPDVGTFALGPATTDIVYRSSDVVEFEHRVSFETHNNGPVTLSIHADCSTEGTYEPLGIFVYRAGETDLGRYVASARLGSAAHDFNLEQILPAGAYYARLTVMGTPACAWSMTIRHPV